MSFFNSACAQGELKSLATFLIRYINRPKIYECAARSNCFRHHFKQTKLVPLKSFHCPVFPKEFLVTQVCKRIKCLRFLSALLSSIVLGFALIILGGQQTKATLPAVLTTVKNECACYWVPLRLGACGISVFVDYSDYRTCSSTYTEICQWF